tara:strand:+ start:376 stop:585 length:210 start_codon:yes stop_codon:yes gene_type:complete
MTNRRGNSVGIAIMLIVSIIIILFASSCGASKLTNEQLAHRNAIQYEIDKEYVKYSHKTDSLWIEYYKK